MHIKVSSILLVFILTTSFAAYTEKEYHDMLYPDSDIKTEFATECYGEYGCFYTGPPFYDPKLRPVTVPPAKNTVTKYLLFTRENKNKAAELTPDKKSFEKAKFNASKHLYFIIHDQQVQKLNDYMPIKNNILKHYDYNVIFVDWRHDNYGPIWQAIANARLTGVKVARFLKTIQKEFGSSMTTYITLIAHGLGAHLAGWTGERLNAEFLNETTEEYAKNTAENLNGTAASLNNTGADVNSTAKDGAKNGEKQASQTAALAKKKMMNINIQALDPTGPYFHQAPIQVRLDVTDAYYVTVMHTNGGLRATEGLGMMEEIGHVDFYPNGGNRQPDCDKDDMISDAPTKMVANNCSHNLAVNLYSATIISSLQHARGSGCSMTGRRYASWEGFLLSPRAFAPASEYRTMGLYDRKTLRLEPGNERYYIRTNGKGPYCIKDGYFPPKSAVNPDVNVPKSQFVG